MLVCLLHGSSLWVGPRGHKDRDHRKGPSSVTSPLGRLAASDLTAQRIILLACVSGGCKVSSWGPRSWEFVMWLQDIEGQAMKAPGRDAEPGKPQEKVGIWGPRTGRCGRTCWDSGGSTPSLLGLRSPTSHPPAQRCRGGLVSTQHARELLALGPVVGAQHLTGAPAPSHPPG